MSRLLRAVAAVGLLAATVTALPSTAGAQVTGGCSATVAGADVNAAQSVRTAIPVGENDTVVVKGNAPGPITSWKVFLNFGGISIPAGEGTVSSGESSYTTTVDVAKYATYGVGLYRVEGETTGTTCTGWAYVKVTGRFPLFTVAGAVAGLMMLGGLVGMIFSWPRGAPVPSGPAEAPRLPQEVLR